MGSLLEMTAKIVSSHASVSAIDSDELVLELQNVYASLQRLETESTGKTTGVATVNAKPTLSFKQAFRHDQVSCMVCGKGGMKSLTRHLRSVHNLKPGAYRRQFGIPGAQPLTAGDFSEARRKMANERHLGDNLARARAQRAANILARKIAAQKAGKTVPSNASQVATRAA